MCNSVSKSNGSETQRISTSKPETVKCAFTAEELVRGHDKFEECPVLWTVSISLRVDSRAQQHGHGLNTHFRPAHRHATFCYSIKSTPASVFTEHAVRKPIILQPNKVSLGEYLKLGYNRYIPYSPKLLAYVITPSSLGTDVIQPYCFFQIIDVPLQI